ncbi:cytochrome c551 [Paenibacillus algorifonticola]|uniref:Cytochrome c551 n=1 Tax=Paenibacillus algorifonticola TaxID=684063 RepID=A0A1I1YXK9_9BACL|nr:cytochrome c [Paenibacillus algorifonticola]SFE24032.1 cytochrome c551 [Paenibacillus algorifonticola]
MISKLKYGSVIGVLLGVLLLSACGNSGAVDTTNNNSTEGMSVQNGDAEMIYKKKCMSCHGTDLQGRRGPSLQNIGSRLTEEEIVDVVTNGRNEMPKFEKNISAEDIQSVSKWLSELK